MALLSQPQGIVWKDVLGLLILTVIPMQMVSKLANTNVSQALKTFMPTIELICAFKLAPLPCIQTLWLEIVFSSARKVFMQKIQIEHARQHAIPLNSLIIWHDHASMNVRQELKKLSDFWVTILAWEFVQLGILPEMTQSNVFCQSTAKSTVGQTRFQNTVLLDALQTHFHLDMTLKKPAFLHVQFQKTYSDNLSTKNALQHVG